MAVVAGAVSIASVLVAAVVPGLLSRPSSAPEWGAAWGPGALGGDAVAAAAIESRLELAAGLLLVVATQALFTAALLILGERERRRPGLGVRWAIGASPRRLVRHLLSRDGRRIALLAGLGGVVGLALAGWTVGSWPGVPSLSGEAVAWGRLAALALLAAMTVSVVAGAVVLAPLIGLGRMVPTTLRRGHGVSDDPRAGTVRRGVAVIQLAGAVAFASAGFGLIGQLPTGVGDSAEAVASAGSSTGGGLAVTRFALASPARLDGPLLASPGAWTGVGVQDMVTVDCGECVVGVWYLPIYGVDTTVHAVGSGVLEALGARVLEGRGIESGDTSEGPLVGVVNSAFRKHFQDGQPIGRQLRLRGGGDRWVRIVGVIDAPPGVGPGAAETHDPVVWVPLAQHPASTVEGVAPARGGLGLEAQGPPIALDDLREATIAPTVWSGWLLLGSGLVALGLALLSAAEVGRIEARGRARATAIRLALGGSPGRLARGLLRRTLRLSLVAAGVGIVVSWVLQAGLGAEGGSITAAASGSPAAPWLALAVVAATTMGAVPRARALLRTEPGRLLRED